MHVDVTCEVGNCLVVHWEAGNCLIVHWETGNCQVAHWDLGACKCNMGVRLVTVLHANII